MKVVKILKAVNLTSGLSTPKNTICTIAEGYADVKSTKDALIPSQIATLLYLDAESVYDPAVAPITGIADYNPVFNYNLSITDYETLPAEELLINAVLVSLEEVYGVGNVEIVTI